MNVLWLTNIPVGNKISSTGSWLENLSESLEKNGVELHYCYPSRVESNELYRITFIEKKDNQDFFEKIIREKNVALVHIHGTEMGHTLEMVRACKKVGIPHVIGIQGLASIISNHLIADLPINVIYRKTLRNIILNDSVAGLKKQFQEKGLLEIEAIKNTKYIIGRTTWDYAATMEINSNIKYFHCNEVLREIFYTSEEWNIDKINRHSIFISQSSYSLKGLHYVLNAMPSILNEYPDAMVYIAGKKMDRTHNINQKLKETYYARYIQKLIKKNNLEKNIKFLGILSAKEMKAALLRTHVFVSPSTMENESNSLSEAKIVGTPVVASYVGGVVDRINHSEDGFLYQHNSIEMLSFYIKKLFDDDNLAVKFSENGRKKALSLFSVNRNINTIEEVYKTILSELNE